MGSRARRVEARAPDPVEVGRVVTLRALWWDGPLPTPGQFLSTANGSWAYRILEVRENHRPHPASRMSMRCAKVPAADLPDGALVHPWRWSSRG